VSNNFTDRIPSKLSSWNRGDRFSASHLDEVRKAVEQILKSTGISSQFIGEKAPIVLRQFKVVSEDGDFLICNAFNADITSDESIFVAKPYLLRRTPFDGLSRNGIAYIYSTDALRTADDGSDTEVQVIVPSYVAGDVIYAFLGVLAILDVENDDGNTMRFLDANLDGRAWAKQAE
jgi:hypothetical protein